nr:NfeD family protein [Brevibacillus fulvus]
MLFLLQFLLLCLFTGWNSGEASAAAQKPVWVPVEQGIERGLESFLQRAFAKAEQQGADLVILHIDTPGGEIGAASSIGQLIRQAPMRVVAYIDNQAYSAGTYIALHADEIVMTPGSFIGAATPIDLAGNAADIKILSAWSQQMETAAALNGRDPQIARAMVQIEMNLPGLKEPGSVLALDAEKAKAVGYADQLVNNVNELYQHLGVAGAQVQAIEPTLGETIARFVTSPLVMSVLLIIGLAGIAVELFAPGFGIAGGLSLCAFGLYFFGHLMAGYAEWFHLGLFLIGLLLMVLELFVPGMIVGLIGFVCMISGLALAAYDIRQGLLALALAMLITVIVAVVLAKIYGIRGFWRKLILEDAQRNEAGYVAAKDQRELLGQHGLALTPLRPAGIVNIQGMRVDAVSQGAYIEPGSSVIVVQVEGARVVVSKANSKGEGE